jgi:hypothetical protein
MECCKDGKSYWETGKGRAHGMLIFLKSYHYFNIPVFRHLFGKVRMPGSSSLAMSEIFWALMVIYDI